MAKKSKDAGKALSGPLDRSPSHLFHRVLQIALDVYAEETGPDGLTQRQFAVLSCVALNEGLTQTDLVRATGIDRSTLADLVARMIGKGYLARERSAVDARANTVTLTDRGRETLEAALPKVEAADRRILALLPGSKRDGFLKVLADMARAGEAARSAAEAGETGEGAPGKKKKKDKGAKADKPAKGDKKKKKKAKADKGEAEPAPESSESSEPEAA